MLFILMGVMHEEETSRKQKKCDDRFYEENLVISILIWNGRQISVNRITIYYDCVTGEFIS